MPRGQAADFECHSIDNKELFEWATNNLDFDQAILEFYTGTPESPDGCTYHTIKMATENKNYEHSVTMLVRLNTKRSSNEK